MDQNVGLYMENISFINNSNSRKSSYLLLFHSSPN